MKSWILVTFFFSNALFFGALTLLYIQYDENSTIHVLYNIAFVTLIMVVLLLTIIKNLSVKNTKISTGKVYMTFLLMILLIATVYGFYTFDQSEASSKILRYVLGLTIPSVFIALCVSDIDTKLFHKIKYINIFLTISFGISILRGYSQFGGFTDVAGSSHLLMGYTMSALYAYNLINLVNSKGILGKMLHIFLIISNIAMIVFSGSRGSIACIVAISMFMIWSKRKKISVLKVILILSVIIASMYLIINKAGNSFALQRMLMVFSSDLGISTSGRGIFYQMAINKFVESPIFGYGVGAYANSFGYYVYPHNIILEILNDFGLIGLIVFLIFMVKTFKNLGKMLKQDKSKQFVTFLFINSFTMLMFSSSYLIDAQFWMSFVLVYAYNGRLNVNFEQTKPSPIRNELRIQFNRFQ